MELETRRLLLRPLRSDDAPAIALGANNLNVSRNLTRVKFPYSITDAREFLALARGFDPRTNICAITFKCAPDELIGIIGYEIMATGEFDFGYWLRECCWHMRIMTEAATAMVSYAFEVDHLDGLNAGFHTDNPNSGRILRNLGFIESGVIKEKCLSQGKPVDCMRLQLAQQAWFAQKESRAA